MSEYAETKKLYLSEIRKHLHSASYPFFSDTVLDVINRQLMCEEIILLKILLDVRLGVNKNERS